MSSDKDDRWPDMGALRTRTGVIGPATQLELHAGSRNGTAKTRAPDPFE